MKKILLIPDSFKGTMSSLDICEIMTKAIQDLDKNIDVVKIPVADGGEGTVDSFLSALGGEKVFVDSVNPYLEKMKGFYGIIDNGKTAVIEMAAVSGLPLVNGRKNAMLTSTYGISFLIKDAINKGIKKIILGLGGSATNDVGAGMLAGLGVKFFNKEDKEIFPIGATLCAVEKIDTSSLNEFKDVKFITMCDINNPLYGESGCSFVFAKQKGATDEQIKFLDNSVKHFADVACQTLNFKNPQFEGAGAAGGLGFCLKAFLNSEIKMGIDTVLEAANFEKKASSADLVITGEGKLDSQSLGGKVVLGVCKKCKKINVPCIAVVGDIDDDIEDIYQQGLNSVFSINRKAVPFEIAKQTSNQDLYLTVQSIIRFYNLK